jgi:hypothetical protein
MPKVLSLVFRDSRPVLTMSISVQNSVMVRPDEASKAISKWMNGIEQVHTYTNTYIITLLTNGGETEGCPTDGAISVPEQAQHTVLSTMPTFSVTGYVKDSLGYKSIRFRFLDCFRRDRLGLWSFKIKDSIHRGNVRAHRGDPVRK